MIVRVKFAPSAPSVVDTVIPPLVPPSSEPIPPVAPLAPAPSPVPSIPKGKEAFRRECDRRRAAGLVLRGNTYPVHDRLKTMGAIWDSREKAWLMPSPEALSEAAALLPAYEPRKARRPGRGYRCGGVNGRGRCTECDHWGSIGETCSECCEGTHC